MRMMRVVAGWATVFGTLAAAVPQARAATLTWFMWSGSQAETAAWQHCADLVHEKYPDITVELQTASFPDYWTKLPALAASHQLPDIVSLQTQRTAGFAQLLEPLDDRIQQSHFDLAAFDKSIIGALTLDHKLYALPYDFGPQLVFYNSDMFASAGVAAPKPGWTQADFVAAAKALTKAGHYGVGLSTPDAVLSYAASSGAPYMTPAGELDLTNPALAASFQSYADIAARDHAAPLFPSSATPAVTQANGRFAAGDIAMYIDGPWDLLGLVNSITFKMGLAPVPAGKAGSVALSAGSGFGISTTSTHKDDAWKAIQVLTGPEAEQYLASNGRAFAARTADQIYWFNTAGKNVENVQPAMQAALANAQPYRTTADWNTVSSLFEQYAPLVFGGKQPAAETLKTIQQLADQ